MLAIFSPPSLSWLGGESSNGSDKGSDVAGANGGGDGGGGASPRDGADAGAEAEAESVDLLGELLEHEPFPMAPPATAPPSHADNVEAPPPSPPSPPGGLSRAFTALGTVGTSLSSLLPSAGGRRRRSTLSARQRQHVKSSI
jgi:hypothetical protein